MGLPITPILIGAGVGALGGALTGNNPFKTALLGGALGTGAGALGLGGATGAAGTAGASLAPEAGAAALGSIGSSAGTAEALGAGTALGATEAAPLAFAPVAESTAGGSLLAESSSPLFGYGASGLSPYAAAAESAAMPMASDIGAGFGAGNISNMIAQDPSLLDKLKPYLTPNNVMGAAQTAMSYKPTQRPTPQGGRITEGKIPQGGLGAGGVEGLLAELQKQRQTQRQPISLLVG